MFSRALLCEEFEREQGHIKAAITKMFRLLLQHSCGVFPCQCAVEQIICVFQALAPLQ